MGEPTPYVVGGIGVAPGTALTVQIPPRVYRGSMTGLLFETDKTFLLPKSLKGIKGLRRFYDRHPGMQVLIVGHTDTVGAAQYNVTLSMERARSISAYLQDQADVWMEYYAGRDGSKPWGTREDQHMLAELGFYTGAVDGIAGPLTEQAVVAFKASKPADNLGSSTKLTSSARKSLVTSYMAIDGTSLPVGTHVETHGCGFFHLKVQTPPQTAEERNRRVEVFFFESRIDPPPLPRCPSGGCPQEPEWRKRTVQSFDLELDSGALEVSVVDRDKKAIAAARVHISGIVADDGDGDAAGVARFADLIPGNYRILARHDGFRDGTAQASVTPGEPPNAPATVATVQLEPATGDLVATVRDPDNRRVAGAKISLKDAAGAVVKEATSDKSGIAPFSALLAGEFTVTATAKGFLDFSGTATVVAGKSSPLDIQLARANLIVRIPFTLAEAAQLPHSFTLTSTDGAFSQSRKLASDCFADSTGATSFDFGAVPEDKSYSLQSNDGTTTESIFDKVPFAKLVEVLNASSLGPKAPPPPEVAAKVGSGGGGRADVANVEGFR